jgi:uncharacterized membrane protein
MKEPTINERWYAAACYACFAVVLVALFVKQKSSFLARHCRQGFALFFAEIIAALALAIIDATIGRIPVLGLLISILLHLSLLLAFLILSVIGFVKALSGEEWRMAFLDEFAQKVPIHAAEMDESS